MKCTQCEQGSMKSHRESVRGEEFFGLPNVILANVEVRRCESCGAREIAIPKIAKLNRLIAGFLVKNSQRLTGAEIRFLRKYLGWSSSDFADALGVKRETVSRWENEKEDMGQSAERVLRLSVVHFSPVEEYAIEALTQIEKKRSKPKNIRAEVKANEWALATA